MNQAQLDKEVQKTEESKIDMGTVYKIISSFPEKSRRYQHSQGLSATGQ